ncbi:hypothetical protein SCANM63S_03602 [Streptomyces canarius]
MQPVRRFLIDFIARDNRTGSVHSYAYDLLRWWRWLRVVDVQWNRATSVEVRHFVLWLRAATKPRKSARTHSAVTAGTTNPITKKTYLDDRYKPRTIRHSNAVLRSFYDFWIETGGGPLVNPVPLARSDRRRPHAHHNPMEPYRGEGRLRYNPKVPKRRPRQMPDERWNELFAALRSNREHPPRTGLLQAPRHRRDRPAVADRAVQEQRGTAPAGQPGTWRASWPRSSNACGTPTAARSCLPPDTTTTNASPGRCCRTSSSTATTGRHRSWATTRSPACFARPWNGWGCATRPANRCASHPTTSGGCSRPRP